ncbi:Universal stress protein F [Neorhizobium galegae bv. officinalis bv. officinalis str. HAMBI 1141]|uniref:Universal stress protein F n=1 Tax=Neorhizobium galegae bv. officinalis bv. officinalis str. HAMBI 1141 TaxID=1028801 RepID=A0A068T3S9_NEOGA|nr:MULTISPECIES: universal stress protein [Neorhizobium]MCJ9673034.1 universal stress protein [Neorhizobium sp. SHOUNA12B]MCJ9748420.1 universal stress protein [Neorhizobium sp. SHOUNA12A]MCJ9752512.1 universal stress protein [Neorhizobium sp. BETTINA12A]CDN53137.1 Universal stress protein F [Neorhizobium galegae bv. officinalis bv. officinalis str. HAMBI 1141]
MYKKIVVAVDVSALEKGERILRTATNLLDTGGMILIVNVVEDMPAYLVSELTVDLTVAARQDAERLLVELREKAGIEADIEIRQGAPAREILAASEEQGADLIIVASHIPDLSNYLIGATADRVVRHATCSVLVDR